VNEANTTKLKPLRLIVAVETDALRDVLCGAVAELPILPEIIPPETLLMTELTGPNLIFLETGTDIDRLIHTARKVYETWGETGLADLQFLSYSPKDLTPDSVVFALWSIGPELTVIVQIYELNNLETNQRDAWSFTKYILQHRRS
jgi:hypothetical protein